MTTKTPALTYYLFNHVPDAKWKAWTLAVLAISERDARDYVQAHHHGGKLVSTAIRGETVKVVADCGAVTRAAEQILQSKDVQIC